MQKENNTNYYKSLFFSVCEEQYNLDCACKVFAISISKVYVPKLKEIVSAFSKMIGRIQK